MALDHFGVETSVVVRLLLQRGPLPLPVIVMTSKLKVSRVSEANRFVSMDTLIEIQTDF